MPYGPNRGLAAVMAKTRAWASASQPDVNTRTRTSTTVVTAAANRGPRGSSSMETFQGYGSGRDGTGYRRGGWSRRSARSRSSAATETGGDPAQVDRAPLCQQYRYRKDHAIAASSSALAGGPVTRWVTRPAGS